jgi:hypothetical protein
MVRRCELFDSIEGMSMKQSKKIAILGIGIQGVLAAIIVVLMLTIGNSSAETARRIGTSIGGIMGAWGAFSLIWWYLARKKEM